MRAKEILLGALITYIIYGVAQNDATFVRFTNVVCESLNKSWALINTCRLRAISRNMTTFNFNGTVVHPTRDIVLHLQLMKKANGYKPWLLKAKIDACRFMQKAYHPFAILFFKIFKEYTNMNHTCPYHGIQIVNGVFMRSEVLRLPLPTGEYMWSMIWFFDKKPQVQVSLYFEFKEDLLNS